MSEANLLVLYGSQTGTAQDVAERLAREAMQLGLKPLVISLNSVRVEYLAEGWNDPSTCVVFVAATTGQGDPPDNMKSFWKTLCRNSLSSNMLSNMVYGVIGLGDSSYEQYNFVGKKLFRRLKQLGGTPLLDLCLGDDQHDLGYHAALNPWIENFWSILKNRRGLKLIPGNGVPLSKFIVRQGGMSRESNFQHYMPKTTNMELRKVVGNERVTSLSHWQDTRLISIDLEGSELQFVPGDVLNVQPQNFPENVKTFFEIFPEIDEASTFNLYVNPKLPWTKISPEILKILGHQPWSWKQVVTYMLDIQSVPRLYFFELMSKFATNELEKERLTEFCTPQGQEELFSYCNRPKRNILEVLQDFPNTTKEIPSSFLFDLIPAIKPRSFSIASSSRLCPDKVQILVAVVEYQTKIKCKRRGLCSNWLAHYCPEGTIVPVWTQMGSFKFPSPDEDAAVIMIGPGTGVAPFRSVITEGLESWNKILFFGCRNESSDFYFKDDWKKLQDQNLLTLHCAFSRDSEGRKRDYVQDKILEESKQLGTLLAGPKAFYIYIAGNAKQMPKDVREAIMKVMEQAGMDNPSHVVDVCYKKGRYQTETWS